LLIYTQQYEIVDFLAMYAASGPTTAYSNVIPYAPTTNPPFNGATTAIQYKNLNKTFVYCEEKSMKLQIQNAGSCQFWVETWTLKAIRDMSVQQYETLFNSSPWGFFETPFFSSATWEIPTVPAPVTYDMRNPMNFPGHYDGWRRWVRISKRRKQLVLPGRTIDISYRSTPRKLIKLSDIFFTLATGSPDADRTAVFAGLTTWQLFRLVPEFSNRNQTGENKFISYQALYANILAEDKNKFAFSASDNRVRRVHGDGVLLNPTAYIGTVPQDYHPSMLTTQV